MTFLQALGYFTSKLCLSFKSLILKFWILDIWQLCMDRILIKISSGCLAKIAATDGGSAYNKKY